MSDCLWKLPFQGELRRMEPMREHTTMRVGGPADLFLEAQGEEDVVLAWRACRECGVPAETIAAAVSGYVLKNGRMQTFRLGGHPGTLLTSKHENSIAYDTNLRYIAAAKTPCSVLVIVDAVSRKYFTSETSWLWDIDFDRLACETVQRVVLSGRYCADLAERLSFTAIAPEKLTVEPDIRKAAEELAAQGSEELFVVTCFSDRDKLLDLPCVKKEV